MQEPEKTQTIARKVREVLAREACTVKDLDKVFEIIREAARDPELDFPYVLTEEEAEEMKERMVFRKACSAFREKEQVLDGECKVEQMIGRMDANFLRRMKLLNCVGQKGKTRIVIEYDNDTGIGWRRIVTEDLATIPLDPAEHQRERASDNPILRTL